MRWSTRLRGVGLLMLIACHLVSSYHSQDYQIWDWGDREREKREREREREIAKGYVLGHLSELIRAMLKCILSFYR